MRDGVDVREQRVAQPDRGRDRVIDRLAGGAEFPDLAARALAVAAHHRAEGAVLQPAHVELLEERVARAGGQLAAAVVAVREEAAAVGVEVRVARQGESQPGGDLRAQRLPRGVDVAAPGVRTRALLASPGRAREDHHAAVGHLLLVVRHALHRHEREGVAHLAEGADPRVDVQVTLLEINMIRLGGVHPPGVDAHVLQAEEVLPVDVASLRGERVVRTNARRVVEPRRPVGQAGLRPGLEVEEQALRGQLAVCLGHRAEGGPDGDHQLGVLRVHLVDHRLGVPEVLVQELHRVPLVVVAPVLPVLDDAVDGDAALAVAVQRVEQLAAALVALAALHEAVAPQREHRHVARQRTDAGDHAVGAAAVEEVVVHGLPHLGLEVHAGRVVSEDGRRGVVPEDAIALDGLDDGDEVLGVALDHAARLAAQGQGAVLQDAQAVERLVRLRQEGLAHDAGPLVRALRARLKAPGALLEQELAGRGKEADRAVGGHAHAQRAAVVGHPAAGGGLPDGDLLRGRRHGEAARGRLAALDDAHRRRGVELHRHGLLRPRGQGRTQGQEPDKNGFLHVGHWLYCVEKNYSIGLRTIFQPMTAIRMDISGEMMLKKQKGA